MLLRLLTVLFLLFSAQLGQAQILTFDWVQRQTGNTAVTTNSIACDVAGNVYVGGSFSGMINFGGTTLTSAGASDAYVAKFSPTGTLLWAKQIGVLHYGQTNAVALSPTGDLYATGYFYDTSSIGASLVNRPFVARFSSNGNLRWLLRSQNAGNSAGNGLAVTRSGASVYITGTEINTMNLGGVTLGAWPIDLPVMSIFISRVDSSGKVKWLQATQAGYRSGNHDAGLCAAVDDSDNVFVGGQFADTLNLGGVHLTGLFNQSAILLSLDTGGKTRWVKNFAVLGTSIPALCSSSGYLYAAGQSAFAMKFESSNAVDKILTNNGSALGSQAITSDGAGGIFVVGNFSGSLAVDSVSIGNLSAKMYILKLDTALRAQWATYTMVNHVTNPGIAGNPSGQRFLCGTYSDSIRLGSYLIGTSKGYTSGFVSLLSELNIVCPFKPESSYCPGDSIEVPFNIIGHFGTNNIFYAELSDSLSQFRGPKQIGILPGVSGGLIQAIIPKTTLPGSRYRVRVTSSMPAMASDDNGLNIIIGAPPKASMTPNGAIDLCEGDSLTLTATGSTHYRWSTGDTTPSIRIGASGDYSVYVAGTNGCGIRLPSATVIVRLKPPIPPVTRSGNTIFANVSGVQYQWYYNHRPISGGVNSSLDIVYNGTYSVTVSNPYHCTSTSDDFVVDDLLPSAVTESPTSAFSIALLKPNELQITNAPQGSALIEIRDLLGRPISSSIVWVTDKEVSFPLNPEFEAFPTGIYYVRVEIAGQTRSLKLIHSR